jgi:hypothetical protein
VLARWLRGSSCRDRVLRGGNSRSREILSPLIVNVSMSAGLPEGSSKWQSRAPCFRLPGNDAPRSKARTGRDIGGSPNQRGQHALLPRLSQ